MKCKNYKKNIWNKELLVLEEKVHQIQEEKVQQQEQQEQQPQLEQQQPDFLIL